MEGSTSEAALDRLQAELTKTSTSKPIFKTLGAFSVSTKFDSHPLTEPDLRLFYMAALQCHDSDHGVSRQCGSRDQEHLEDG